MKNSFLIFLITFLFSCTANPDQNMNVQQDSYSAHRMDADELHVTDQQIQLGNIKVDSVKERVLEEEVLIAGIVNINQQRVSVISTRVMGRIEKLYYKNVGEVIGKGAPLYEIYSEDLNIAIRELRLASEKYKVLKSGQVDLQKILTSARNKLRLYGLTDSQVNELENSPMESNTVKILSPVSGVITSIDVKEGGYVMQGASTFHLADLSTLWIYGQVYSDYLGFVSEGTKARITFPGLPNKVYEGKVSFIDPELNAASKINMIRVEVLNTDLALQPGIQAYIHILSNKISALAVPTDAIIMEEKSSTVWVRTDENMFKSRMVTTGLEANGFTEIKSGLQKGDRVVVSGAYLLNSEFIFQKGINPMEGHDMDNM